MWWSGGGEMRNSQREDQEGVNDWTVKNDLKQTNKWKEMAWAFETPKPTSSDTILPVRSHLLILLPTVLPTT